MTRIMSVTRMTLLCVVAAGPLAGCVGLVEGSSVSKDPDDPSVDAGASCTDECQEGASQCSTGVASQTCAKGASGCLEWQPTACSEGETCALGYCARHGTWRTVAPMPVAGWSLSAVTGADGDIYVTGGTTGFGTAPFSQTWKYSPATNTWARLADMGMARAGLASARAADGRIYALGGYQFAYTCSTTASVEAFLFSKAHC